MLDFRSIGGLDKQPVTYLREGLMLAVAAGRSEPYARMWVETW